MASDGEVRGDGRLDEIAQEKALLIQEREQLVAKVQDLDHRIACLSTEYRRIHNAIQPISKLPSDLLHLVFHLFRGFDGKGKVYVSRSTRPALQKRPEVTLSAVCAQWRHACLSFGDLWSTFRTRHPGKHAHERLAVVLQRSGSHPLDLWFDFRDVGFHDLPDPFHLLEDCLKHVHRWRRFTIVTNLEDSIRYLSERLVETEAPLLEQLTLLPDRALKLKRVIMTTDEPVTLTGGTPKLTYLCLNNFSAVMFTPSFWTVTDLRLDMAHHIENYWIQWELFLHILRLPALTTLSMMGQPFDVPQSPLVLQSTATGMPRSFPIILMPNLRHLRQSSIFSTGFVDLILPNLRAPNLETLTLKNLNIPSNQELYWTNNTNVQPFPNLHTLVLIEFKFFGMRIPSGSNPIEFDLHLSHLTSRINTLVISDKYSEAFLKPVTNKSDPFTLGWKNIKTFALNARSGTVLHKLAHLQMFVRLRKGLKTLWLPRGRWSLEDWAELEATQKCEGCRTMEWREEGGEGEWLGLEWPPGSKDSDEVDSDFLSFNLFDDM